MAAGEFFGEYHHQIDEKCRIRIPSKFKEILGDKPFFTRGANNTILILKHDEAKKMLDDEFGGVSVLDPLNSMPLRLMGSTAFYADEDKQGRIILTPKLMEHAKIKEKGSPDFCKDVVFIGAYNRIEIWRGDIWEELSDKEAEDYDKNLAAMNAAKKS
jgi:MraZ protein